MKGLPRVFIIVIITSCTVISCAPPIGTIGEGSGTAMGGDADALIASPKKTSYDMPQKFLRYDDLNVFLSYQGVLHSVPIEEVDISVIEDLSAPDVKNPVPQDPHIPYEFSYKGQKKIVVEYNELTDEYYVDVTDPTGMGGNGNGNGNGNGHGPGIEVIWAD